jgi:hypothetical protein
LVTADAGGSNSYRFRAWNSRTRRVAGRARGPWWRSPRS